MPSSFLAEMAQRARMNALLSGPHPDHEAGVPRRFGTPASGCVRLDRCADATNLCATARPKAEEAAAHSHAEEHRQRARLGRDGEAVTRAARAGRGAARRSVQV